jgi:hypothetical protein
LTIVDHQAASYRLLKLEAFMFTTHASDQSQIYHVAHWTGCLFGAALLLIFVAFAIGAGPPPANFGSAALIIMCAGFLVAFRHDLLGGVMSLIGVVAFYLWNLAGTGYFPGGWVFPFYFVPGLIQLFAWAIRPNERISTKTLQL